MSCRLAGLWLTRRSRELSGSWCAACSLSMGWNRSSNSRLARCLRTRSANTGFHLTSASLSRDGPGQLQLWQSCWRPTTAQLSFRPQSVSFRTISIADSCHDFIFQWGGSTYYAGMACWRATVACLWLTSMPCVSSLNVVCWEWATENHWAIECHHLRGFGTIHATVAVEKEGHMLVLANRSNLKACYRAGLSWAFSSQIIVTLLCKRLQILSRHCCQTTRGITMQATVRRKPNAFNLLHQMRMLESFKSASIADQAWIPPS